MTREEAIEIIKEAFETWKSEFGEGDWGKEDEALDMAISALEQMPETTTNNDHIEYINYPIITCDDTISREAALKECHDIVIDGDRYRVVQEETLVALPSVTPSRRKGHWIDNEVRKSLCNCSECGGIKQGIF